MGVVRALGEVGRDDVDVAGGKGANLGELVRAGLPVPPGFVITTEAQPDADRDAIVEAYAALSQPPVAVRSSATAEDLTDASFAGQQDTFLNVRGTDALLDAVRACSASLWNPRAVDYRARRGTQADPRMAVVVQEMVEAEASGVMFTANPATGRRDQVVVSAAWGLGESVVGGTVDTDQVVLDATGRVTVRTTADKAVRTVYADHGTHEEPVPEARRRVPVLDDAAAAELAALGRRAADHFGAPQDLEWAYAEGAFWIVQSRPITALPPPEAPPPTSWTVPHPHDFYVRASIVEQLPDPLSPLFAELVDGSVTRSLVTLMTEFVGRGVVRPDDVSLPTVNGYAYYRYTPGGMARLMLRTPRALPVLTTDGPRSGVCRWREREHPAYVAAVARWKGRDLTALTPADLVDGIVELLDAGARYYTAVQTIIPLAAAGETLLTTCYDRLVRRRGDPPAATLLLGFSSEPIRADQSVHDLATWTRDRPALADWLLRATTPDVAGAYAAGPDATPDEVSAEDWAAWVTRLTAHLDRYGHAVYNLDFVHPTVAERPGTVLDALRYYVGGGGADPYERERRSAERRDALAAEVRRRVGPVRRAAFDRLLRRAQTAAPLREDALADIGLAWPTLRALVLELGRRLVEAGVVDRPEDAFWLESHEILGALDTAAVRGSLAAEVEWRRELWRGRRRATPPQILPQGRWFEVMRRFMPAASETQTGDVITGISGSAGTVTGTARLLGGPDDFDRLQPGEILVASITTPAWTPLFARAGGVVTDIGGPLSHSSIVAREYGIPAVLGTGVATHRIADGARVEVDGDAGTVRVLDAAAPQTS